MNQSPTSSTSGLRVQPDLAVASGDAETAETSDLPVTGAGSPAPAPASSVGPVPGADYRSSLPWRVYDRVAEYIDHRIGWDKLPTPLGLLTLIGVRNILRQQNLTDSDQVGSVPQPPLPPPTAEHIVS